nr:retrovirus-related Pol polyprotein from transposon TNT 1-94 [Tanacetum cinerariifolium]
MGLGLTSLLSFQILLYELSNDINGSDRYFRILNTDHAGCKDDCKNTSGGIQFLGEKLVSWSLINQDCTAMSTAEAEYVSLSACCAQVIWMRAQLLDCGYKYNKIPMYCDSEYYLYLMQSGSAFAHNTHKHLSRKELEAKENKEKVKERLMAEEIEKLVEGTKNVENVEVDSSTLRQNDNQIDLGTRLEPRNDKESPDVEIIDDVQPVNVNDEEEESAEVERQQSQADVAKMTADAIQKDRENLWVEIYLQINNAITNHIPSQVDSSVTNYMSRHILHVHPTQASPSFAQEQQHQLYLTMRDNPRLQQDDLPIWLALNAKRQKTFENGTFVFGETSSGQDNESEPCPSTLGKQKRNLSSTISTKAYSNRLKLPKIEIAMRQVESEEGEIIPESVQNDAFIDNIAESEPINGDSRKNQYGQHILKPSNHPSGNPFGLEDLIHHYEYEKVEALRKSTTPQDSKKVRNDQTFHQVLEESVNNSSGVSKTAHADSMAGPVKQRNGFSILERFQEFIDIGQAMGYKLKGAWGSEEKAVGKETLSFESVDGEWIENPNRVKSKFYSYYSNLFSTPAWDRSLFDVNFPRRLNSDQVFDLEDMVSNEEIKRAVWDCGSDKSQGPDGFTFEFFKKI